MDKPLVLLPRTYADCIAGAGPWGYLLYRQDAAHDILLVGGYTKKEDGLRVVDLSDWHKTHHLSAVSISGQAPWYRAPHDLHLLWRDLASKSAAIAADTLKEHIEGWRQQGSGWVVILVTEDEDGDNHFSAWAVSQDQAAPVPLDLVEDDSPRLAPLVKSWPITTLIDKRVGVLGVGSIGSATAQALVSYGVGKIVLVDPDRLLWHNLARHQLPARYVGLNKAEAMADWLLERDPKMVACGFDLDVIEDADALRAVLPELDIIITTTDGVESRQAANHLAVRAGLPNVLACVLDNGSYAEVIRVVPGRTACLWCYRQTQIAAGGFNPEPSLDRGYGEGTRHLPMTAVTGDLMLVGNAAAKVAVATLLERCGRRDQRLPGDLCITGLQPNPSRRAPFDIQRAGESRWHDIGGPGTHCPTCQPTAIK